MSGVSSKYAFQYGFETWHFELKEIRFHFNSSKSKKIDFDDTEVLTENDTLKEMQVFW